MNEPIEPLNIFDTDYADIVFSSDNPSFELQLVKQGIDRAEARTKTKFITLLQKKPETVKELEELVDSPEEACGYRPDSSHLEATAKLLWSEDEKEII